MSASELERRVNLWRGWSCLVITKAAVLLVLANPRCFVFWDEEPAVFERTGTPGLTLSLAFLAYLVVDTVVSFVWRQHFRRSMGAVYLHHLFVGVGVIAFLLPSPPRGFFLYVWGEALTACRVLPPKARWTARYAAFAFRRVLWLYLLGRDVYLFPKTLKLVRSVTLCLIPPGISLLLLVLDAIWWAEHARTSIKAQVPAAVEVETLLPTGAPLRLVRSESRCGMSLKGAFSATEAEGLKEETVNHHTLNLERDGSESLHAARRLRPSRSSIQLTVHQRLNIVDEPEECDTP